MYTICLPQTLGWFGRANGSGSVGSVQKMNDACNAIQTGGNVRNTTHTWTCLYIFTHIYIFMILIYK